MSPNVTQVNGGIKVSNRLDLVRPLVEKRPEIPQMIGVEQ